MTMTQDEILRLGAKFALHLLYRDQHDQRTMSEATASADYGNLWELLAAGLDGPKPHPQVALDEIIERVTGQLNLDAAKEHAQRQAILDAVWERR